MKHAALVCLFVAMLPLTGCIVVDADTSCWRHTHNGRVTRSYENVSSVSLETVSGDCNIEVWDAPCVEVQVDYRVRPANAMTPRMCHDESNDALTLTEEWRRGSSSGHVRWKLAVPPETEIGFFSSSGDLQAEGLAAPVKATTCSGRIGLRHIRGDVDVSGASGAVVLDDINGHVVVDTASGNVTLRGVQGDVEVDALSGNVAYRDCSGTVRVSTLSGRIKRE